MSFLLLVLIVVLALCFDFINGFHDTANAIATVVSTRVLTPRQAIMLATVLNLVGALVATNVAKTIGEDMVEAGSISQWVILSALVGAIMWNLITWYFGLPSSSSHALIGGLVGAVIASGHFNALHPVVLIYKVLIPIVAAPIIGFVIGYAIMLTIMWGFFKVPSTTAHPFFRRLQLVTASFMAFSHGSNDAQKSMGIITLALASAGYVDINHMDIPRWVILSCAVAMAAGTSAGGWRIIRTMGSKIIRLEPVHGVSAETAASIVILTASRFGIPLSTTHVLAGSIMGVGASRRLTSVNWGTAVNMSVAWVLTLPAAGLMGAIVFLPSLLFH